MDLIAWNNEGVDIENSWLMCLTAEFLSNFPILPKNAIAQTLKNVTPQNN